MKEVNIRRIIFKGCFGVGDGVNVLVDSDQRSAGNNFSTYRPGMAATAQGTIDIDVAGPAIQVIDHLVQHCRDMSI